MLVLFCYLAVSLSQKLKPPQQIILTIGAFLPFRCELMITKFQGKTVFIIRKYGRQKIQQEVNCCP